MFHFGAVARVPSSEQGAHGYNHRHKARGQFFGARARAVAYGVKHTLELPGIRTGLLRASAAMCFTFRFLIRLDIRFRLLGALGLRLTALHIGEAAILGRILFHEALGFCRAAIKFFWIGSARVLGLLILSFC